MTTTPAPVLTIAVCGPSTDTCTCTCRCAEGGPCDHRFDGPEIVFENGATRTCRHCCMEAIAHDMAVGA